MMVLDEVKRMTRAELLELARENKLRVTSQMSKNELVDAIMAASKKRKEPLALNAPPKPATKDQASQQKKVLAAKRVAKKLFAGTKNKSKIKLRPEPPAQPLPPKSVPRPLTDERPTSPRPFSPAPPKASEPQRPAQPKPTPPAQGTPPKPPTRPAVETRPPLPGPKPTTPPAAIVPPKPAPKAAEPPRPAPLRPAAPAQAKAAPIVAPEKPAAKRGRKKASAGKAASKGSTGSAAEAKKTSEEAIRQMAEEGKYYLGTDQQVMPPVEAIEVPAGYNVDRIVALVRDPYWIFAYWEVTDRKFRELERLFGNDWPKCRMVLRVYDRTSDRPAHFDIDLTGQARNWYINVSSERRYQVAIGALSPDGRFEQIAISNVVETPSYRVSDRIDEEWMIPDDVFKKIFDASGGTGMHASSAELKQLLERRFVEEVSSGAVSSFGSGMWPKPARAFRLWVATELILYGGTEPDARVTVQGKEVKLRPDGTFSLRFALPDGKIGLPVTAASADGIEERTITTDVSKRSEQKAPVVK
jgi:hypothetical protein